MKLINGGAGINGGVGTCSPPRTNMMPPRTIGKVKRFHHLGKKQCNVISATQDRKNATQDKKNATQDKSKCPPRTNFPCGLEARN